MVVYLRATQHETLGNHLTRGGEVRDIIEGGELGQSAMYTHIYGMSSVKPFTQCVLSKKNPPV
jgi:hypothetical protein